MRTIENPETFRKNVTSHLNGILKQEKRSTNLEKAIYNYSLKEATQRKVVKKWDNPYFVELYTNRLRTIYINLSNPELLEQIESGQIKSHDVAFMTHQEMNPKKWDPLIQAKIKKDKTKYETNMEAATDTFKCRKCHKSKCTYYQLQTRSADEPMTTFVQCLECGNRWRC
jgi:transcription elongation factor S-II